MGGYFLGILKWVEMDLKKFLRVKNKVRSMCCNRRKFSFEGSWKM